MTIRGENWAPIPKLIDLLQQLPAHRHVGGEAEESSVLGALRAGPTVMRGQEAMTTSTVSAPSSPTPTRPGCSLSASRRVGGGLWWIFYAWTWISYAVSCSRG